MGINIIALRVLGEAVEEIPLGQPFRYWNTESIDSFDSCRYAGDRDFIDSMDDVEETNREIDEESYFRPRDISKTKEWVEKSGKIPDENQDRLLKLLDLMEEDKSVYLKVSY